MSTRTQLQTLINTNLANASSITAAEHREVENSLLNELYPTVTFETRVSNSITTENTTYTGNNYQIYIAKQGRKVTIYGSITNSTSNMVGGSSAWFFEIIEPEFKQKEGTYAFGPVRPADWNPYVTLYENRLECEVVSPYETFYFTITYFTEN